MWSDIPTYKKDEVRLIAQCKRDVVESRHFTSIRRDIFSSESLSAVKDFVHNVTQIAKFMWPTWGPPGSCRPQMGPMLDPWTLLSGYWSHGVIQNGRREILATELSSFVLHWNVYSPIEICQNCFYLDYEQLWNTLTHIWSCQDQGAVSIRKTVLPGMAIPMLKIRRPNGRLIFNMEIAIRR